MAKNREPVVPDTQSSEEEDDFVSSELQSDSESDPREVSNGARKPRSKPVPVAKPDAPAKSRNGATKPRSKPVSAAKRPEEEEESDGEKSKEVVDDTPEKTPTASSAKKKQLRLWSEDDVIAILKGMVDYSAEKKANPVDDLDEFLDFIKNDLHAGATKKQLQDKIRKLKGKYEANKRKERPGKERILPNPYEQIVYELSKSIWGKKDNGNEGVVRSPLSKRKGSERAFPVVAKRAKTVEEMVSLMGDKLFENGEGDEEWNELKLESMETYLRHLEIEMKRTKLVIDRLKSGGCEAENDSGFL